MFVSYFLSLPFPCSINKLNLLKIKKKCTALFVGLGTIFVEFPQGRTLSKKKKKKITFNSSQKIKSSLTLNQLYLLFILDITQYQEFSAKEKKIPVIN